MFAMINETYRIMIYPVLKQATRITLRHKSINSTREEVKAMEKLRDQIQSVFPNDSLGFPYSLSYLSFETNKVKLLKVNLHRPLL